MDPDERIRRREERRRKREDRSFMEQETFESKTHFAKDTSMRIDETTSLQIGDEKNIENESEHELKEEIIKCNGDENHNEMNGEQNGINEQGTKDLTTSTEENGELNDSIGVKVSQQRTIPALKPSEEPEALNIYKEMKMKKEQSTENALLELRMEKEQTMRELEELKKRKAERARQWEEADRIQKQYADDRRKRQQEEEQKRKEEFEKQKKEREIRMKKMAHNPYAYQAPVVTNGAPKNFGIRKFEAREREKRRVLEERVPPLDINSEKGKDALQQLSQELIDKLKTAYGKFFDLRHQTERSKYTIHELKTRIKAMKKYSYERQAAVGGLSNIVKQLEQAQSTDVLPKSRLERERQAGSILSSGGVKARLAMFGGGSLNRNEETPKRQVDLTK